MDSLLQNQYVVGALTLFISLYASLARPELPPFMMTLFENPIFKVLFMFLAVYLSSKNIQLSLMISVAFVVTLNLISEQRISEGFTEGIREGLMMEGFEDSVEDSDENFDGGEGFDDGEEGFDDGEEGFDDGEEGFDDDDEDFVGSVRENE